MNLRAPPLPELIYQRLREQIVWGLMAPGCPVRQDEIAARFGVSKIPLREALARLEQDGLVVGLARRGYEVAAMSAREADEIFRLRLAIEPDAAAAGSAAAGALEHAAAAAALAALERAVADRAHSAAGFNRAFHLALAAPAAGALTMRLLEQLHVLGERYVHAHLASAGRGEIARAQHRDILEAWLARDAAGVAGLLARHVECTRLDLGREFCGVKVGKARS